MGVDNDGSHYNFIDGERRRTDVLTRGQALGAVQQQCAALAVDAAAKEQQPVFILLAP